MDREEVSDEEKTSLRVEPKLITVDGADGAGASTVALALAGHLRKMGKIVQVIEVPEEEKEYPREVLEKYPKQDSPRVNLGYLRERKIVYKRVEPALRSGTVVILVASEVKNLMHAILDHNELPVIDQISKGVATRGMVAGTRVIVGAPLEKLVEVLQERKALGQLSSHDPQPDPDAIASRVSALKQAADIVQNALPGSLVIEVNNSRLQTLDQIAEEIVSQLKLPSN